METSIGFWLGCVVKHGRHGQDALVGLTNPEAKRCGLGHSIRHISLARLVGGESVLGTYAPGDLPIHRARLLGHSQTGGWDGEDRVWKAPEIVTG